MSKIDDYINGLEGKEDLTIESVVSDLLSIHNDEMGIANAKISELDAKIVEGSTAIADKDAEIQRVKAKNWDLANQVPTEDLNNRPENKGDGKPDATQITIDDLFEGNK
jgi:hypothetical protein